MKRIFFLGLVICLVGWAGKAQAQKVEKVDGMLYRIIGADEVALVGGDIKTMEYTVPSTVTIDGKAYTVTELRNQKEDKPVYSLKSEQFGKVVRSMVLPNTIRRIGFGTFHYHPNLQKVVLPLSLDEIGYNAFWHCTSLRQLEGLNSSILYLAWDGELMTRLAEFGLLQDVHASGGRVQFRFESPIVRQCLNDIGVWLEMYVYKQAVESGLFDDVQISVVVDWDGDINESINTINEIDLILTRGVSSLFVSCKSGVPSTMALNEINTLTEWFGGMFSKGVIVTMCELSTVSPATYRRAIDMGLCVIQKEDMEAGKIGELLAAAAPAGTLLCPAE